MVNLRRAVPKILKIPGICVRGILYQIVEVLKFLILRFFFFKILFSAPFFLFKDSHYRNFAEILWQIWWIFGKILTLRFFLDSLQRFSTDSLTNLANPHFLYFSFFFIFGEFFFYRIWGLHFCSRISKQRRTFYVHIFICGRNWRAF